ncbi:MAG: hypothetical protein GY863_01125 [bacterium]|nr:hypothetical protein [bacterium]
MKSKHLYTVILIIISSAFIYMCSNPVSPDEVSPNVVSGLSTSSNMIIITTPEFEDALTGYISWKEQRGLDVEIDVVSAGNGSDAIMSKLQNKYDNDGLKYIIIVGDIDDVPSIMLQAYPSDPSYTLLEGDDLIGDALISRISVNNVEELDNQINKILIYEKGEFENFDWVSNAVVASMTGFDGVDHSTQLENALNSHPDYFSNVIKIMESDTDITQRLRDAIENTGVNFIAHHGHGSPTAFGSLPFSRNDAAALNNTGKGFPIIHGAACSTGSFWIENGDCIAEAFMKAGTVENPAGTIAFVGATTSMDPVPCIAAQKEAFMNFYFDESVTTIGELFYKANTAAMEYLSSGRGESLFRRMHLFGDCSSPLWKKAPINDRQ